MNEQLSKKYKTIFFDMDGTLSDSQLGITRSMQYALKKADIIVEDEAALMHMVGPPLDESFAAHYGFSADEIKTMIDYFREYYTTIGYKEQTIFPGIFDLIKELSKTDVTLAIATSKPTTYAKIILEEYGILDYFAGVYGGTKDRSRVKKTDVLTYALEQMHITDLSHTLMVGDREHDLNAANACGVDSVGVLYGYGSRDELEACHPTYLVKTVNALSGLLKTHI